MAILLYLVEATMKEVCVLCGPCYRKPEVHSASHLEWKICDRNYKNTKRYLEVFSVIEQIPLQKNHCKTKFF